MPNAPESFVRGPFKLAQRVSAASVNPLTGADLEVGTLEVGTLIRKARTTLDLFGEDGKRFDVTWFEASTDHGQHWYLHRSHDTLVAACREYIGTTDDIAAVREHLRTHGTAEFQTRDATLSHWITVPLYLDADGDVVMSHPTDPGRRPIAPPSDVSISLYR